MRSSCLSFVNVATTVNIDARHGGTPTVSELMLHNSACAIICSRQNGTTEKNSFEPAQRGPTSKLYVGAVDRFRMQSRARLSVGLRRSQDVATGLEQSQHVQRENLEPVAAVLSPMDEVQKQQQKPGERHRRSCRDKADDEEGNDRYRDHDQTPARCNHHATGDSCTQRVGNGAASRHLTVPDKGCYPRRHEPDTTGIPDHLAEEQKPAPRWCE